MSVFTAMMLSEFSKNYSQRDKEFVSSEFKMLKFHRYVFSNDEIYIYADYKNALVEAREPQSGMEMLDEQMPEWPYRRRDGSDGGAGGGAGAGGGVGVGGHGFGKSESLSIDLEDVFDDEKKGGNKKKVGGGGGGVGVGGGVSGGATTTEMAPLDQEMRRRRSAKTKRAQPVAQNTLQLKNETSNASNYNPKFETMKTKYRMAISHESALHEPKPKRFQIVKGIIIEVYVWVCQSCVCKAVTFLIFLSFFSYF